MGPPGRMPMADSSARVRRVSSQQIEIGPGQDLPGPGGQVAQVADGGGHQDQATLAARLTGPRPGG